MNSAERKILHVALALFVVGLAVRFLPWGLPSIDYVDIGERPRKAETPLVQSKVEYAAGDSAVTLESDESVNESLQTSKEKKPRKKKAVVRFPLHINVATADELCALKGVGPKLAEKIIAFREVHGPFTGGASLQKVPGIGKKKLEGILQWVIFD